MRAASLGERSDQVEVEKFHMQDVQYEFPYHYIPHFDRSGTPLRVRHLRWGFEYLCYQRHIKAIVEALRPSSAIEVGCGDGYLIGSLAATIRRVGVDLSEQAIRFAKAFRPDVEFLAVDAATIRDRFDVVLAVEVLEHIPDGVLPAFIAQLGELACPGGALVLSVPSDAVPVHAKHHRHYTEQLLLTQVAAQLPDFRVERVDHVYAPPRWLELLGKLTCNRHVVLELPSLNTMLWKYVWGHARLGERGQARHIVGVFRKPSETTHRAAMRSNQA